MTAPVTTAPTSPWAPITTLAEKAVSQGVEGVLAAIILAGQLDTSNWQKLLIAFCAAFFTVLANGTPVLAVPTALPGRVQVVLRAIRSFAAAFFAPVAAAFMSGGIPELDGWKSAAFAGVLAGLAVIKGALVAWRSKDSTPALLPARYDLAA